MRINLNDIETKYNPRIAFEGITELAGNIKDLGLLQPLTVTKNGNGKYVLLDGGRRLMALQKLKWTEAEVIVRELDEQKQKEVPIATDYFKNKLSISEKAIGVANIINKEKKVTEKVLANRYGWKLKDVKALLVLSKLHMEVLKLVDSGSIDVKQALEISEVKREDIQIKIAKCIVRHPHFGLLEALEEIAFELPFDDVFTFEQSKKDKKIGIVINDDYDGERVFTYDKEYYDQKNKEFEEREEKAYEKQQKKAQQRKEKELVHKEDTKEERKQNRDKAKVQYEKTLNTFHDATKVFLSKKPTETQVQRLLEKFVLQIGMDNCKLILKAFQISFKASEMQSSDFKREVLVVMKKIVTKESDLLKLIIYVDCLSEIYKTTMFDMDGVKKMIVKLGK